MSEHTPENHELDAMVRDFTSVVPRSKSEVSRRIHEYWKDGYQAGRQSLLVEIEECIEESEWECPEHGKEYRITPPLCKECNQCLEVNLVIANLGRSILKIISKGLPTNQ